MAIFRSVVIFLLVVHASGLSAQTIRFPNNVPPLGKRTFAYKSTSLVSSDFNPKVMDSNYLANTARVDSYDFDHQAGIARILHVTIIEEKKATTTPGGVSYVHGPVVGRDYFIRRSKERPCIIYKKTDVPILKNEKQYLTDEYSKYLWDEVMWGIVKGRTLEMGEQYKLQPEEVGRLPLRSKIDTLKGPITLTMIGYDDSIESSLILELSLSYKTLGESEMLRSTGQHVLKMIIDYKTCRLIRLKEEYEKTNYAKEIMTEYFTQVVREVVVTWEES